MYTGLWQSHARMYLSRKFSPVHEGTYRKMFTTALPVGAKVGGNVDILPRDVDNQNVVYAHDRT